MNEEMKDMLQTGAEALSNNVEAIGEAVVEPALHHKPRLNSRMDILVNTDNFKEAYDASRVNTNNLLAYFVKWLLLAGLISLAVIWWVRRSSLSI